MTLSSIQAQNDLAFKAMRSRAEDEREEFASHVVDTLRLDLERYHRDSQERQTRELRGLLRRVLAQLDEPAAEAAEEAGDPKAEAPATAPSIKTLPSAPPRANAARRKRDGA